jgi:hypothetical protein
MSPRDHLVTNPALGAAPAASAEAVTCADVFEGERWRWDLNPRRGCPLTRFRGVLLRPLGHATAVEGTRAALPERQP